MKMLFATSQCIVWSLGLLAFGLSSMRADVPVSTEEDPFQVDSHWKGKLTQRGTHPDWGFIPGELDSDFVITQRDGNDFAAELHENTDSLDITFSCKGRIVPQSDRSLMLTFESIEIKAAQNGTVGITGVQYTAKFNGKSMKGNWKCPQNNRGITLEGEYEWTQE
ncbi:MAG TPA: hypothetical protein VGZ47_06585 [Gemmataceae bacterium]|jgi:hypothetical protein|nr:hypothetical protein [Gemmataceae bacterium]